ncbi:MAG: 16S rRNA (uracil(1498)-N(3))-methyltransferase [Actinomycetaceae bacterium]|nr:16S rRNA (uracil(1498)-N(3))-methyltransferase [Actinomycetaceae bacterium]
MTAPVFFASGLEGVSAGSLFRFEGGDAKHVRVKRIEVGERIDIVDGEGTRLQSRLVEATAEAVTVEVESVLSEPEGSPRITLIQALAKNGRDELAIEMATELGVDRVIAWQSQRAIVRWDGRKLAKNLAKWENILRAATKQSRRSRVPSLDFAASAKAAISLVEGDQLVVMHEAATEPISKLGALEGPGYALVVGPEGGITDAELAEFERAGARIVLVGEAVMRVSTAVAAGMTSLNIGAGKV